MQPLRRQAQAVRLSAMAAACASLVLLAAACGSAAAYRPGPTLDCMKQQKQDFHNVHTSAADTATESAGDLGLVEADIGRYTVDVVFFKEAADAKAEIATVRANEQVSLAATPPAQRERMKEQLANRDYVVGNTRIRWRRGPVDPPSSDQRDAVSACLRGS